MNKKTAIVLLAAGEGKRYGGPKQLATLTNRTLIEGQICLLQQLGQPIYVAVGAHRQKVIQAISSEEIKQINVTKWRKGLGQSIKESANYILSEHNEGVSAFNGAIFVLADQPFIALSHYENILTQAQKNKFLKVVGTEYKGINSTETNPGVPVFFPLSSLNAIVDMALISGARQAIMESSFECLPVTGSTFDIDTPKDMKEAKMLAKKWTSNEGFTN